MENNTATENSTVTQEPTKFCKHCGAKIPVAAVICTHCGCQVEEMHKSEQPSIVINNANTNTNTNTNVNTVMPGYGAWPMMANPMMFMMMPMMAMMPMMIMPMMIGIQRML